MAFQSTILNRQAAGIPGELAFEGPLRATPAMLNSASEANNVFGRLFTVQEAPAESIHEGLRVQAGGTGMIVGILANPKAHVQHSANFEAGASLPNGVIADFVEMGALFVDLAGGPHVPGSRVVYATATGILSAVAPTATAAGTGNAFLPGAKVIRYVSSNTAPYDGLAVIQLTDPLSAIPLA